ncbi:hypothetical protein V8C26DRAFT_166837 [Trichoderma gracile]
MAMFNVRLVQDAWIASSSSAPGRICQGLKKTSFETVAPGIRSLSTGSKAPSKSKGRKEEMEQRSVRNQQVLKMVSGGRKRRTRPALAAGMHTQSTNSGPIAAAQLRLSLLSPLPRQGQGQTPPETGTRLAEKQKNRRRKLSGREMLNRWSCLLFPAVIRAAPLAPAGPIRDPGPGLEMGDPCVRIPPILVSHWTVPQRRVTALCPHFTS